MSFPALLVTIFTISPASRWGRTSGALAGALLFGVKSNLFESHQNSRSKISPNECIKCFRGAVGLDDSSRRICSARNPNSSGPL